MDKRYSNEGLSELIANDAEHGEKQADAVIEIVEATPEGSEKTRGVIGSFIRSYKDKAPEVSNKVWLCGEFSKYPGIWVDAEEIRQAAGDVVDQVERFDASQKSMDDYHAKGLSTDHWLAEQIEQGARVNGIDNVSDYASEIDDAIGQANKANIDLLYRKDGQLNQQLNLDGFIAEQHHVDTFNLDAAAKGSDYRAEVLQPKPGETYGKNSVDIVIRDGSGKISRRYQAKYGADTKATDTMLKKGDYRGQRKLVPESQSEDITGSTETIEIDGIKSKPLSKEAAKERQHQAQEKAKAKQYDWNEVSKGNIAQNIAQKAAGSAMMSIGFQGARIAGRRIWNRLTGKKNNSADEDLQEFVHSSLKSAGSSGLAVAVTGGVTVAAKSGWLGKTLKDTPVGRITNAVSVGIEHVKTLYKYATGEITGVEAADQAGRSTVSLLGSLAAGSEGTAMGATLGSVLGPIGTVVGGIAGGMVGSIAGSAVGEAIYEGGKKIVSTVVDTVKSVGSAVCGAVAAFGRGIASILGL